MNIKTGIAKIKIDKKGNWLEKSVTAKNEIKHFFIAQKIDDNFWYVSFFTSQQVIVIRNENIPNIWCNSKYFKFINPPTILEKKILNSYIETSHNITEIGKIFDTNLNDKNELKLFLNDALMNFKKSFILPNDETFKIINIKIVKDKVELNVETKSNIITVDSDTVYTNRFLTLPWNNKINIEDFKKNIKPFLTEVSWASDNADELLDSASINPDN